MTSQVVVAEAPAATEVKDVAVVALTVQPDGAGIETFTPDSAEPVPLVRVVVTVAAWPAVTNCGPCTARESLTTMTMEPVTPPTVTLIVATPSAPAVTMPAELTVATAGLLLEYVTDAFDRFTKDWSLLTASTMSSAVIEVSRCSLAGSVSSLIQGFFLVRSSVSPAW